jgi:hypothetical protein
VKVSVIGVGMRSHAGIAHTMFGTLAAKGINIQAISTSEIKISVLIGEEYKELALRALHSAYGLDRRASGVTPPRPAGAAGHDRLDRLWARGRRFLGCELAVMGGAMTWVSERNLVSAISEAGGFGVLACGSMGPEQLAEEIAATRRLTARPFGVNLIVMHPELGRWSTPASTCGSATSSWPAACRPAPSCGGCGPAGPRWSASRPASAWPGSWPAAAPTRWSSRAWRPAATSGRSRPPCWRRRSCPTSAREADRRCSSPAASATARWWRPT